ncbi:TonB-dependent receptor [candidate division KSB1 bacterium]|nr:TonB-dependent receptor [candidate division KSB1 bacterium]
MDYFFPVIIKQKEPVMNTRILCAISAFISFLLVTSVLSASRLLTGTVTDATTGEGLPGANVMLVGTSMGAATNLKGEYRIANVPPGRLMLRATFIGYQTVEKEVVVEAVGSTRLDIELDYGAVIEGESIVITAQAEGQLEAINQQLAARSIVNVVSSARIQELPDANAAESVGRLPGVAILRSGGEGEKVVIRGMSPQYNNITINGVKMAATGSGDRSANLSMISPYMLEGIEVSKAALPDQDADIIGGTVNFRVKEAAEGLHYDVIAQGGYNDISQSLGDYKYVGTINNRFANNRFGLYAQIDVEGRDRSSDELGASYKLENPKEGQVNQVTVNNLNLRAIRRDKNRFGGALVMDYRLPNGSINFTNFASHVKTEIINRSESFAISNNNHIYSTNNSDTELTIMTNALTFRQNWRTLQLHVGISNAYSKNTTPKSIEMSFQEAAAFTSVSKAEKSRLEDIHKFSKNDLTNTFIAFLNSNENDTHENDLTGQLDVTYDITPFNWLSGNLKMGGKYRHKSRAYDHQEVYGPINWGGEQPLRDRVLAAYPQMQDTTPLGTFQLPYSLFFDNDYSDDNFFDGKYTMGPVADVEILNGSNDAIKDHAYSHATNNKKDDYEGTENYSAGYIMSELNISRWFTFIPGVRYERNRTEYTGIRGDATVSRGFDRYDYTDTTTVRIIEHWLPMVHLRTKPTDWFDIRLAYTHTLARPNYNHLIPSYTINNETVSWNNYRLKPALSRNIDVYASFYQNHVGLFTAGGFYKEIDDLIFGTGNRSIIDPAEYDLPAGEIGKSINYEVNNPNTVTVKGIELDWQTTFWYLPGVLKGLVLNVNYTHAESEAKYPRTIIVTQYLTRPPWIQQTNIDTSYTNRLINQPDEIINMALGYDYKRFSFRISMLYQSNIFKSNNFWPELRGYTDDYLRWDISLKQGLPIDGLMFFMNLNNISSAADINLNAGTAFPTSEQHYGMTIDMGLRYRL